MILSFNNTNFIHIICIIELRYITINMLHIIYYLFVIGPKRIKLVKMIREGRKRMRYEPLQVNYWPS